MDNRELTKYIRTKFHIKPKDNLPFFPWLENCNRTHLAELFAELKYTRGAEIGVRTGNFSIELLTRNSELLLYCVDPWSAYARVSQDKQNRFYRSCQRKLKTFNAQLIKETSMDGLKYIENGSLDFVYLDGRHEFDFIMTDLIEWSKKVKSGGIVSGHDYYNFYQGGVITAVNAYTLAHNIQSWYITKEVKPSFFWINP